MRKFLSFSILNCFILVAAQAQNIPDVNFANAIRQQCPACINASDNLLPAADTLTILNVSSSQITDLTGIDEFVGLINLDCGDNELATLPTMPDSLKELTCSLNQLTNLPVLPTRLEVLNCLGNRLTNLPALPRGLKLINCFGNDLTSLPALPMRLETLICVNNQLTSLPELPNSLKSLKCFHNQLTSLPTLPYNLEELWCSYNQLTNLPALPNTLIELNCASNQLSSLVNLPTNLNKLWCGGNLLSNLPALPHSLTDLHCGNNIALNCLPILPATLVSLITAGTNVNCIPNFPPQLTTNLPLCNANNNTNNCLLISAVDNIIENQFAIFPNPNKGNFNLRFADNMSLENANLYIYNFLGELIMQQKLQNANQNVQTNDLPAATYIVKVQTANATFVQKMIIE